MIRERNVNPPPVSAELFNTADGEAKLRQKIQRDRRTNTFSVKHREDRNRAGSSFSGKPIVAVTARDNPD